MKCAVVLLFLGGAFYLKIEAARRRSIFPLASSGVMPAEIFFIQIDVNHADAEQFEALPGVGKFLAHQIIQYRHKHGFFTKQYDLLKVKGIGPKRLKQLAPYLVFPSLRNEEGKKASPLITCNKQSAYE
jgi:competence ComEA-like helix-hairpin-helix protein